MRTKTPATPFGITIVTLLFLIVCAFLTPFYGGVPSFADEAGELKNADKLTSILYNSSNGLPTSEANAVAQTADGFIWIGGYSGLIRYDGNEFYRYPSSTGIFSVVSLFVDSKDNLWIGTNDNGAARLNGETFTFFNRSDALRSASIRCIAEDENGDIILATTEGLSYIDKNDVIHLIDEPQVNKEYIRELYRDGNVIYGVTRSGCLFTLSGKRITSFLKTADISSPMWEGQDANSVYPDPYNPGYVYVGTKKTALLFHGRLEDLASCEKISVFSSGSTINDVRYVNGTLWVCSDNGVGYFRGDNFVIPDFPMTNSVDHMITDYEGNLWFTSSRQGVMKVAESRFIDISGLAKLPPTVVNSTCKYGDDLYIATDNGPIILGADYSLKENAVTELLRGIRIRCLLLDRSGRIWFCTYGENIGLVCYYPETYRYMFFSKAGKTVYDEETGGYVQAENSPGILSESVRSITELSDGRLAVATESGVNIIENDEIVEARGQSSGLTNPEILCIEEAYDGTLYLGSNGDGVYLLNGNRVSRIGIDDGLQSEVIMRIKKDPVDDKLFWIITSNSIARMKDGAVTTIRNFPYSNNFDIHFDSTGKVWIRSSNGIYVIKRDDLLHDLPTMEYTLYDGRSGLPANSTANSFCFLDGDGTLYVCASSGVYSVNIDEEEESSTEIRLSVPFIYADDAFIKVEPDTSVVIPSDCKRLKIYANAFTFSLKNPHLSYKLEGFDDNPVNLTKQNMMPVTYTNLAGGTYEFTISIVDPMTGEVKKSFSVTIVKEKAIYERAWFWVVTALSAMLLVVGITFLAFRRKTVKLMRKQKETQKLINEMTKVFANCIDMKDAYTNGHSLRVATYTAMMAKKLGKSHSEVERIYNIALLHDIGKISIPDQILNKQGRLDDAEYMVMKSHSSKGYEILKDITIAPGIALGAGYHHERYDGRGYPSGLRGDQIPEVARIIAVADAFDAMYSTRPYRKKLLLDDVVAEIKRCSGTQFSPEVVAVFEELVKEGAFNDVKVN